MGFIKDAGAINRIKKENKKRHEARQALYDDFPFRWYMKQNTGPKRVIFLTGGPPLPMVKEHRVWPKNQKVPNYYTCPKTDENFEGDCPLCDADNFAYDVGFFLIVDRDGYVKDDEKFTDQVKILPAKLYQSGDGPFKEIMGWARGLKERGKDIVFTEFEVERGGQQSATVGSVWNYYGDHHSEEEILEILDVESLDEVIPDWNEYLEVLPIEKLAEVAGEQKEEYTDEDDVSFND